MKISQLGWVLSAAIVGVGIGGGAQFKNDKVGWINMQAVFEDSNLKRKNEDRLRTIEQARVATLEFLGLVPAFNSVQLARFRELSIKETLTGPETAELTKLKDDAQAAEKQYEALRIKQNPTPQEIAILNDLGERNRLDTSARGQWAADFDKELQQMQLDLNAHSIDVIKAAIAQAAKPQGYTLVFRENAVIYGSRDLGPEVKKIADKNAK